MYLARNKDGHANQRNNPMNPGPCCPGKNEQPNRKNKGAKNWRKKAVLLLSKSIIEVIQNHVEGELGKVQDKRQDRANLTGQERRSRLSKVDLVGDAELSEF